MAHTPAGASANPIKDWSTADDSAWVFSKLSGSCQVCMSAALEYAYLAHTWEITIGISEDIAENAMIPYDITSFPAGLPLYHQQMRIPGCKDCDMKRASTHCWDTIGDLCYSASSGKGPGNHLHCDLQGSRLAAGCLWTWHTDFGV